MTATDDTDFEQTLIHEPVEVIISGHLCLDLIPPMEHIPLGTLASPGRMFEVGPLDLSTGGCVSNTGLALHRLGVNVRLMATVGDDPLGSLIIDHLEQRDRALSQHIRIQPGESSSYTIVLSPGRTDRMFLHCTGTNATFDADTIDFGALVRARLFHLGYPPLLPRLIADDGSGLADLFRRAKATGVVTSMDMTLPDPRGPSGTANWQRILQQAMPYVDLFVPSIEEILFMLRRPDYDLWQGEVLPHLRRRYLDDLADEILGMGGVIVGFKLGAMGVYLRAAPAACFERLARLKLDVQAWAGTTVYAPAYAVTTINTVGAGDAAYAGLLAALLRGLLPRGAAQWACAVGACNVEAADATSGVRSWQATQARMAAGWPLRAERLA